MSGMDGRPMPGGWLMSMAMMAAMMLPSSVPLLWRYHRAAGESGGSPRGWLTALAGAGYFAVWAAFGAMVFPLGAALAAIEMRMPALVRATPIAAGVVVLLAGSLQLTRWKARRLACLDEMAAYGRAAMLDAGTAWRDGLRLGLDCAWCCAGLMAIPRVVGMTDLGVMAAVTAAAAAERLAPAEMRVERVIGIVVVGAGLWLIAGAAWS